jgi:hypothetical protein
MFNLFKKTELLDEPTIEWLFDIYAWALRNLDAAVFYNEVILVTPSNNHFPGRESSLQGMAELIFEQVKQHAGLSHWPCQLIDVHQTDGTMQPKSPVAIHGAMWGSAGCTLEENGGAERLPIAYDPALVSNPEALIAYIAQQLAHQMASMIEEAPPGGHENWLHLTEVLAVMLGFGLMFANTALIVKTGCGGCGSLANRNNALGQFDITYALAIFCVAKGIPAKQVIAHLKSSLRGYFKRAVKDVQQRQQALARLPIR